ncbi:ABC transporter permease [Algoriphagus antarcticus]|uniref:Putative ABC transport system permease protein n=1 Tax=Algoriphagus antarcticus TaxID=238540 RepID=A0A3E0D4A0_9BACT|nr:FtsX-like permease family protein [Algoriphagus antarcticus]REG77539.1 putative ABC transport system permease protein [Algoriphagus antarcticus]
MNIGRLSIKNILSKPLSTGLSLVLLSLGVGIISLMLQIDRHLQSQMTNNTRGIDMVVGAKGSPLQLILSAVFQIDVPTGNISLSEAEALQENRLVEFGIPLSYGDSYEGFRIVGTTEKYPELYSAIIAGGSLWKNSLEVTLGSKVAEKTGLQVGDTFLGSHGLSEGGHVHEEKAYVVTGVFEPSGSVIDQLILTGLESVWDIHDSHSAHEEESMNAVSESTDEREDSKQTPDAEQNYEEHDAESQHHEQHDPKNSNTAHSKYEDHADDLHEDDREITAMLIKFRNPMGMVQLPRMVNEKTNMQAALPNYELLKLFSLMGIAVNTLNILALAVMLVSGLSVFISLYLALKERTFEMALLRTYGATRSQLLGMVLLEGLFISILGFLLGMVASSVGLILISILLKSEYLYEFSGAWILIEEWYLAGITLVIGIVASLIPAFKVFNINLSKTLADA